MKTEVSSAPIAPTCTCETKCEAGKLNAECPVCGAEGATVEDCKGKDPTTPTCNCETKCEAGKLNAECPVCGAEGATVDDCKGKDPTTPTTFDVTVAAPTGWTASTEKLTAVDATTGKTYTLTSDTLGAKDYTVTAGAVDGLTITSEVAPGKDWVITETAVDLSSANDLEAKKSALKAAITNGSGVVGLVTNKTAPTEVLTADDIDALTDQTIAQEYYTCTQEATATVITVTVKATKAAAIAADTLTIAAKDT